MKLARIIAALGASALAVLLSTSTALAEPMDPSVERLVLDPGCHSGGGPFGAINVGVDGGRCRPDNIAFKRLMSQYAMAIAPTAMHTARTTGLGGFHLSLEAQITEIDEGAAYWKLGTQGVVDSNTNSATIRNTNPASMLQLYSLKFAKSFGFGLELSSQLGFMPQTSIISGGADVRLSLLEGFRQGLPGILPDVAVGGAVRTITGTPQVQLTVVGVDGQISKPLPIADSSVLTPFVGYQYLWVYADSGLIDLTPATDALQHCNYAGTNIPGTSGRDGVATGQPVCRGGSSMDFNNNVVFQKARLERQRMIFGLSYRWELVTFSGAFITDIVDPADAQTGDERTATGKFDTSNKAITVTDAEALQGMPRQWSMVFQLGTMF